MKPVAWIKKDSTLLKEVINKSTNKVKPESRMNRNTGSNRHLVFLICLFFFMANMVKKKTPGLYKPGVLESK